jgi:hypothetical protein
MMKCCHTPNFLRIVSANSKSLWEKLIPRGVQRVKLKRREEEAGLGEIDPVPQFSDRITFEEDAIFELAAA